MFHQLVAQLQFINSISRTYIQGAVSFITTRVKCTDDDDWGKLKRVVKYLKVTKHTELTFRVEYLSVVKWWIYTYYNKHGD